MSMKRYAKKYADYYARISPETLNELSAMLEADVVFIDPFNKLHGRDVMVSVFEKMFETMTNPQFEILDIAYSEQRAYLKWRMTGVVKAAPKMPFDLIGMSEVEFNSSGRVVLHHDHWDSASQLLSFIPYVGWIVRRICRLFSH